jgi:uncharacterized protein YecE (DUF72 family)
MPLIAGTSGWQYDDWRGAFYPADVPKVRWLEEYATAFEAVENNGTFYRLARPHTFAAWHDRTPAGFLMAVKASRYLTHVRRLSQPAEPVQRLLTAAAGLGDRLGPILLQLPPNLPADPQALGECLRQFAVQAARLTEFSRSTLRICVEFRHESWWQPQVRQLLERHNAAACWTDRRGRPLGPLWRTADWGYLRLHEGAAAPWPHYGRQALRSWLGRIEDTWPSADDVFAFFNNDQHAAAPADAATLLRLARRG